jgi:hypothetical protein
MQTDDRFANLRREKLIDGWSDADVDDLIERMRKEPMQYMSLVKACEYCGGPDHAIGLRHAVTAVEYRSGDTVKRVEFDRSAAFKAAQIDWLFVRAGVHAEK